MKKSIIYCILVVICILENNLIHSQIPSGYYAGTENKEGNELKTALYHIIKEHIEYPYTSNQIDIWDILKETDKDTNNLENVILIYSGLSVNAAQEYNNGLGWTREHIWAKSHGNFGTEPAAGTDAHAIRPCEVSINSARSNLDFAEGGNYYPGTECKSTSNSWEPRDAVKGDVARMLFYMATRYQGENGDPKLQMVDYVDASPNKEPFHGKLAELLKWNQQDTVDSWERHRNNVIYYQFQHNRNPYIDHPEFANLIFGSLLTSETNPYQNLITVCPNPVKDWLTIQFSIPEIQLKDFEIKIIDLFGRLLISQQVDSNEVDILCTNLAGGLYVLQINNKSNCIIRKKLMIR